MISPITTMIEVTAIRNNTITTPAATAAEVLCGARGIPCIVTMNETKYTIKYLYVQQSQIF